MANITSVASVCCLTLSLLLKEKVIFPGVDAYAASLMSYFTLQQTSIHPECIVSPTTTDDVSITVKVLTSGTSLSPVCPFAVRSGGHSTFTGASNIQGGVTIDLRGLDAITKNRNGSMVSVGAGATWGSVYAYLDNYNLSVVGGRTSSVGVAGLSLGGGISYFGPRYGWTCDTVINFETVLANGSVINANENEHPDLLSALRGGGNNFGIVTRVDMQSFRQGSLWGGNVQLSMSTHDEEIAALAEFSTRPTYDENSSLIGTFGYSGNTSFIINSMEYTKDEANPAAFQQLLKIPSLSSTLRTTNMTDLSAETEMLQANGMRAAYATVTISPTVEAINATVGVWNASVSSIRDIPGIVWSVVFEPLPPVIYARHAKNNALGLDEKQNKPLMVILLSITWSESDDDGRVSTAMRALIKDIKQEVGGLGDLDPFLYLNYAAAWQDPIASYGQASAEMLDKVQREYDPKGVFANYVPGFKIPK
ncbi:FAD-binding domain-containing protein [Annulohypoxylon maeteangense]|uniref:FAD-binding domain-containing protein n=1 Tax=Annulohypoxylon maeteangense TaxID=1927788 RepID=UPI002008730E|nr:FAD-binding domain-containing protein [Annulohypoxylon maeteangense]KAI0885807.1 FAD-binding domain-containing protein [Annulohypoxylon maeteangense]